MAAKAVGESGANQDADAVQQSELLDDVVKTLTHCTGTNWHGLFRRVATQFAMAAPAPRSPLVRISR
jgi:hypothetical protein